MSRRVLSLSLISATTQSPGSKINGRPSDVFIIWEIGRAAAAETMWKKIKWSIIDPGNNFCVSVLSGDRFIALLPRQR